MRAVRDYQAEKGYPFSFFTEADISLSKDKKLMELMRDSCFNMVFVGLESPDETVLRSMGKNTKYPLLTNLFVTELRIAVLNSPL